MPGTVVSIGNFDGVHRGHAALIERARTLADDPAAGTPQEPGRVVALAFDPHPKSVLRPGTEPERLTTFEQRAELLRKAGADEVRRLAPDADLLGMTPETFLGHIRDSFAPIAIVEGADFHFGKGRSGHVEELRTIGARMGFAVEVVEPVEVVLGDDAIVTASSSIARWLLAHGRVRDAATVLGRPHEVTGEIVRGDRRGRGLGFPTANVRTEQAAPDAGVYACLAVLPDGSEHPAAVHVGERPTIADGEHRVEAHVLGLPTSYEERGAGDWSPDWSPIGALPEYGWRIGLRFVSRLRDPIGFGSLDRLKDQLARDCARAAERLGPACSGPLTVVESTLDESVLSESKESR
jgi:riboflavin kinase/FMN adenylyltransferase